MGRPPINGGPSFRFNQAEIAEMEAILQAHKTAMPERQVLVSLAEKFSNSEERSGKIEVQMKQVWNWFQNRRYAIRAKAAKSPGTLNTTHMTPRDDSPIVKGVPQTTQPHTASSATVRSFPQAPPHPNVSPASVRTFPQTPQHPPAFSVQLQSAGRAADNSQMEYEAKSARDGAWYDVSNFLSHRSLDTSDPEVLVRFAGFGAEEDEWVNVRKNVRQRSLPCESSECVAVLPADLVLCFQEGKEQALYFDAHVLDAQRRRHDVRGCRCRFLVRYDHDQSEEIVALRKICRRPETDYRLQQLHAVTESRSVNPNKNGANNNIHSVSTLRVYPPAEVQPKQQKVEPPSSPAGAPQKRQRLDSTAPPVDLQQNQHSVQPAVPASLAHPLVEPQNVEPMVLDPSTEVQVELQKVQPVMPDSLTEVELKEVEVEPTVRSSTEMSVEDEVVEPQKEDVVCGSSVEVPSELHEVQPDVLDQPRTSALETKTEEPVVPVSTNDPNVDKEAPVVPVSSNEPKVVEVAKTEEPIVPVNEPNVVEVAKTEEPMVPVNEPNVVEVAKTEEPVVPVNEPNMVEVAKTEEPVVPVLTNEPNMVEETKTEEPIVPVSTNEPMEEG